MIHVLSFLTHKSYINLNPNSLPHAVISISLFHHFHQDITFCVFKLWSRATEASVVALVGIGVAEFIRGEAVGGDFELVTGDAGSNLGVFTGTEFTIITFALLLGIVEGILDLCEDGLRNVTGTGVGMIQELHGLWTQVLGSFPFGLVDLFSSQLGRFISFGFVSSSLSIFCLLSSFGIFEIALSLCRASISADLIKLSFQISFNFGTNIFTLCIICFLIRPHLCNLPLSFILLKLHLRLHGLLPSIISSLNLIHLFLIVSSFHCSRLQRLSISTIILRLRLFQLVLQFSFHGFIFSLNIDGLKFYISVGARS